MKNFVEEWLKCHGTKDPGRIADGHSALLKPITYELRILEVITLSFRKEQMEDLIRGEKAAYEEELKTMGKSFVKNEVCDRDFCNHRGLQMDKQII